LRSEQLEEVQAMRESSSCECLEADETKALASDDSHYFFGEAHRLISIKVRGRVFGVPKLSLDRDEKSAHLDRHLVL
jgi:hypothetical protein